MFCQGLLTVHKKNETLSHSLQASQKSVYQRFVLSVNLIRLNASNQDFRTCQSLIQRISSQPHAFPPDPQKSNHETLAGKNVQRGLAAKVQDLSATFRKKQRVYMESACPDDFLLLIPTWLNYLRSPVPSYDYLSLSHSKLVYDVWRYVPHPSHNTISPQLRLPKSLFLELSGHAAKNQDLLVASGAIHLKGSDGLSAVDDDIQAVVSEGHLLKSLNPFRADLSNLGELICRRSNPWFTPTPHMSWPRAIASCPRLPNQLHLWQSSSRICQFLSLTKAHYLIAWSTILSKPQYKWRTQSQN